MIQQFMFTETQLSDLWEITPFCMDDSRGFFMKSYEQAVFREHGILFCPFEGFYTQSRKGTVRGLHFQRKQCQGKLVQVLKGAVYDVSVDLRQGSETFGIWQGFHLTALNKKQLYIPPGFAHGFLAMEDTLLSYLCDKQYDLETDGGIYWNDPQLAIDWPLTEVAQPIVSEKDAALPTLELFVRRYGALEN